MMEPVALWERSELVAVRGYFLNHKLESFINYCSLLLGPEIRDSGKNQIIFNPCYKFTFLTI